MAKANVPADLLVGGGGYDPVCAKTGRPYDRWIKMTFYYTPPWVFFLLLAGILPFVFVLIFVRKAVTAQLPVAEDVWKRRRIVFTLSLLSLFAGIGALIAGASYGAPWPVIGLLLLTAWIVLAIVSNLMWVRGRLLSDERTVLLSGAHPDFLARLNQLPPPTGVA